MIDGVFGKPVKINNGEVTVTQVKVGTALKQYGEVRDRTDGMFVAISVTGAATGPKKLELQAARLLSGDVRYEGYQLGAGLSADPGFQTSVESVFEVDPAQIGPPGASGESHGASIRLLSLTRADQLSDAGGGQPALPEPGAVGSSPNWRWKGTIRPRSSFARLSYLVLRGGSGLWRQYGSSARRQIATATLESGSQPGPSRSSWCRPVTPINFPASRSQIAPRRRGHR